MLVPQPHALGVTAFGFLGLTVTNEQRRRERERQDGNR